MYDPESARDRILETFSRCDGNMRETAKDLGCHYATLLRLVKKDAVLSDAILKERSRLHDAGVIQRGFGPYQRSMIESA